MNYPMTKADFFWRCKQAAKMGALSGLVLVPVALAAVRWPTLATMFETMWIIVTIAAYFWFVVFAEPPKA